MYQVKCKAIALAAEAREFKKQERREKRLRRLGLRDAHFAAGRIASAERVDRRVTGYRPVKDPTQNDVMRKTMNDARMAKWKARAAIGKLKAQRSLDVYHGIRDHRFMMIRTEARATYLAYAFLRGKPYSHAESFSYTQPNWERVKKIATRYAGAPEQEVTQRFAQWMDEALNGVTPKWSETLVPGSVQDDSFDPEWVEMQRNRDS